MSFGRRHLEQILRPKAPPFDEPQTTSLHTESMHTRSSSEIPHLKENTFLPQTKQCREPCLGSRFRDTLINKQTNKNELEPCEQCVLVLLARTAVPREPWRRRPDQPNKPPCNARKQDRSTLYIDTGGVICAAQIARGRCSTQGGGSARPAVIGASAAGLYCYYRYCHHHCYVMLY